MKNLNKILSLVALVTLVSQVMPSARDNSSLYKQYEFTDAPADEPAAQSQRKPATVRASSPKPSRLKNKSSRPNPYEQYAFVDKSEGVEYRKVSAAEKKRIQEREDQKKPRKVSFDEYLEKETGLKPEDYQETGLTPAVEALD